MKDNNSVPKSMKEKVEPIIKEIEAFCYENLNDNFNIIKEVTLWTI